VLEVTKTNATTQQQQVGGSFYVARVKSLQL